MLTKRKIGPAESFDSVVRRLIDIEDIPSMEEVFKECDSRKQRKVSTKEVLQVIRDIREGK